MIGPWDRIEGSSHDDQLDAGVEARVADPLWMLARQWQVGELRGDDAARPVAARLAYRVTQVASYRCGDAAPVPMPTAQPLERVVEAGPPPSGGAAGLRWASRLASQVSRRLARADLQVAAVALAAADELRLVRDDTVALPGPGSHRVDLLRRRSFDGAALLDATAAATDSFLAAVGDTERSAAIAVIGEWREDVRARFGMITADAWDETRLEHRFAITAPTDAGDVVLTADQYPGGHLDWYSFDVEVAKDAQPAAADIGRRARGPRGNAPELTAIPVPVRYAGMPASRWWAFEDGDVHVGDLSAAASDLGRLLVADYATVYGNDWYSIPLRVPTGSLAQVRSLRVHDTMGGHVDVDPAALVDPGPSTGRAFRLFELTGDPSVASGRAPLLFVPPSLSGSMLGPVVERVELVRDEAANLAWGIERLVEGPAGTPVDRVQHWRTAAHRLARATSGDGARTAPGGLEPPDTGLPGPPPGSVPVPRDLPDGPVPGEDVALELWRYRLETTAPPYWVPFVPVRIASTAQIGLRRARMREWDQLDRSLIGAKGELLQRRQPMVVAEEEVPSGGATLERRWQAARWTDGSLHLWVQRSKRLGRGERSAGVRWDTVDG